MSSTYEQGPGPSGTAPAASERPSAYTDYEAYEGRGASGSAALAGWLLMLGGLWSFFIGLALLNRAAWFRSLSGYSSLTNYTYHWNLSGWGWAHLGLGILVFAAGICVLLGQTWARWAGIVLAVLSGIASFMFLPFYPFWSILVIAIDVFIIWALMTAPEPQDA
ncbi:MAG TPA: hypothetical protein VLX31_05790 [Streptosporangiaceae bacterium]|nr:hypothetical protein [Streptosporangiaceae bacterium]